MTHKTVKCQFAATLAPALLPLIELVLLEALPLTEDVVWVWEVTEEDTEDTTLSPFLVAVEEEEEEEEEEEDDDEAVELVLLLFLVELLWSDDVLEEEVAVEEELFWVEDVVAPLCGSKPDPSSLSIVTSSSVIAMSLAKNSLDEVYT